MAVLSIIASYLVIVIFLGLCIFHALATVLGFSAELIHRDSPKSPLYDPNSTSFSRFRAAVPRSANRATYFSSIYASANSNSRLLTVVDSKLISSKVTDYNGQYLMKLGIGPRENIHAMLDTGSRLTWVLCKPCKRCYKTRIPIFDPKASSTYKKIQCQSDACSSFPHIACRANTSCKYEVTYDDRSFASGRLSSETLGFDSSDGNGKVSISGILFGCTHKTRRFTSNEEGIGIAGLNSHNNSLTGQLNSAIGSPNKFSYCLPNGHGKSSRIYFGHAADISGPRVMTTPLFIDEHNNYFLDVEKIVLYHHDSMPLHFAMKQEKGVHRHDGNIMIDSGTTVTFILDEVMNGLTKEVVKTVPNRRVKVPKDIAHVIDVCFDWSEPTEDKYMPGFTFYFANDTELEVMKPFLLLGDNLMCLTIASARHNDKLQIIGSLAHLTYATEYDLDKRKLNLSPGGC